MLSPKLRLASAVTLAVASLTFLAVTLNAAKMRESVVATAPPLTAKILRPKDKLKTKPDAAELAALRKAAKAQDTPEERQLEDTTPKHVPLKVKIRTEKEKSFKDLKNDKWVRELEVEVENTGTKPIYFLHLQLHLDTVGPDGKELGFLLVYGRVSLVDVKEQIKPEDVPINPGETHVFKIADRFVKGYEGIVRDFDLKQPKKVKVIFQQITFGDGTGLWNASGEPLPRPKRSANDSCKPKGGEPQAARTNWPLVAFNVTGKSRWFQNLPALAPASFFVATETSSLGIHAGAEPDTCCPGSSCTWAKPSKDRCYCSNRENSEPDIPSVAFPSCGDSSGGCSSITSRTEWCDYLNVDGTTFRLSCQFIGVFSCFDYAPTPPPAPSPTASPSPPSATPTPTPTSSPTCDPATKPNNTNCFCNTVLADAGLGPAFWDCGGGCSGATAANYRQFPGTQGYAGCPPNKYNDGTDCCRCIVQTCPDGQPANVSTCECPAPMPTPTPTPNQPGGGGGPVYYRGCVDYYWVYFVSYDGGETWEATGEWEYAGCFYVY